MIIITCVCIFALLAIMYECSCLTCFYFFFIGIPCVHGYATIHYLKRDLADYLDKFFSVKTLSPHVRGLDCFPLMAKICGLRL